MVLSNAKYEVVIQWQVLAGGTGAKKKFEPGPVLSIHPPGNPDGPGQLTGAAVSRFSSPDSSRWTGMKAPWEEPVVSKSRLSLCPALPIPSPNQAQNNYRLVPEGKQQVHQVQ